MARHSNHHCLFCEAEEGGAERWDEMLVEELKVLVLASEVLDVQHFRRGCRKEEQAQLG